ncbi:MAG: hypothetical protein IJ379_03335 [Lachnospiraceae bacterium]|nr:hypothetical protein [Lachnospiraceae bacterium]
MLKRDYNKTMNYCKKILCLAASLAALMLALYTLHDLQTAEGAGLYLSMVFGHPNRTLFDILVDIVGMLFFLTALLLPCLFMKRLCLESFFRFLAVYTAFMPIMHPGKVVHLADSFLNITFRQSLLDKSWGQAFFIECAPIFDLLKYLAPLLLILWSINKAHRNAAQTISRIYLPCTIALFIAYILFDSISDTILYLFGYLLLIQCFREWEQICKRLSRFENFSLILFFGCLLRGIYRMLESISLSHL